MPRSLASLLAFVLVPHLGGCGPSDAPSHREAPTPDRPVSVAPAAEATPDDRPIVVFVGTSLTAGLGLSTDEDTYVAHLVELADSAGVPFRAVNAGVSGETSAGALRRVDWVLREPLDVLFLEMGANDGLRGQDPAALEANLTQIIQRTRARYPDVEVVLAGMEAPPNLGPLYTAAFREVFPRVARSEGAALIPFLLDGVAGIADLNQTDRIHPTPDGHRHMARVAWLALEPVLRRLDR